MLTYQLYLIFIYPIIFILPAYAANGAPVIFGSGMPLDMGRKFMGKRIFGSHKTVKGLVSGIASGILVGLMESFAPGLGFMAYVGIAQAFGAHAGDLLGSFVKRRAGMAEGKRLPLVDQYPFLIIALLFCVPLGHMPGLEGIAFLVVLTGIMHPLTNSIANLMKLKDVPW